MYVKVSDDVTGLTASFYEATDFYYQFGYEASLTAGYGPHISANDAYFMNSHSGFYGNLEQNPYSVVGISENGEMFVGSQLSARTITMNYTPSLAFKNDNISNAMNRLNALLEITDRALRVDVYGTEKIFTNYFYVDQETDSEAGLLQMTTADTGQGVYWSAGAIDITNRFFEQGINYVAKDFPAPIIEELAYPMKLQYMAVANANPIFKFGCNKLQGKWQSIKVTLNDNTIVYDNSDNDAEITIDTDALTCVNQDGVNKLGNLDVDTWPTIRAGMNTLSAQINGTDDWDQAQQWLGQDAYVEIQFERLTSGVE